MSIDVSGRRWLLRAEILHHERRIVAHTIEVGSTGGVFRTDERIHPGEMVSLRLSFPGLLEPLELLGTVVLEQEAAGPGDEARITIRFDFRSDDARERFKRLLDTPARSEAPRDPMEKPTYRVLLVEDNNMIRDMFAYGVRKYFRSHDHVVSVDLAGDGAEAWQMLEGTPYDLAIIDYYLPVMNGVQLITRVRNEPRLAALPVVAISIGGPDARGASLAAGADMFLDKPIVLRDLFHTLEELMARRVPS